MDPFYKAKAHIELNAWHTQLTQTIFQFRNPQTASILVDCESIEHGWDWAKSRANSSKIEVAELQDLAGQLLTLQKQLLALLECDEETADTLGTVLDVVRTGSKIIREHALLSGLTEGFSLLGTRDHVHDSHFKKMTVFEIDQERLRQLTSAIRKLLPYGQLVPAEEGLSRDVGPIQTILMGYGIAMLAGPPGALFTDMPEMWRDLQSAAKKYSSTLILTESLRTQSHLPEQLHEAALHVQELLDGEKQDGRDLVKLDGFFGTKKGVEQIRRVFEHGASRR